MQACPPKRPDARCAGRGGGRIGTFSEQDTTDMTPEEFERERLQSAETLGRAIESGRGADVARTPESVLGPEAPVKTGPGS